MAIELEDIKLILSVIKKNHTAGFGKLLILGDANIAFTSQQLLVEAKKIGLNINDTKGDLNPFLLGEALGFESVDTLDINGKTSLNHNLQEEIPENLFERYDFLIDAGVLFWCFNPAAGLENIYKMVKGYGIIVHITAISGHYGRGYYNIHPRLFEDFYLLNNCEFIMSSYRCKPTHKIINRVIKKLLAKIKLSSNLISYNTEHGNYFLNKSTRSAISFGQKNQPVESTILPNNVVGTIAFKKHQSSSVTYPCLTS